MNKLTHAAIFISILAIAWPTSINAARITYSLDNKSVCNTIFTSPNLHDFFALREFFDQNPRYVAAFNPADYGYCVDLNIAFGFYRNSYQPKDTSQYYENCLGLDDQQVAAEYESFIRIQSILRNCRL